MLPQPETHSGASSCRGHQVDRGSSLDSGSLELRLVRRGRAVSGQPELGSLNRPLWARWPETDRSAGPGDLGPVVALLRNDSHEVVELLAKYADGRVLALRPPSLRLDDRAQAGQCILQPVNPLLCIHPEKLAVWGPACQPEDVRPRTSLSFICEPDLKAQGGGDHSESMPLISWRAPEAEGAELTGRKSHGPLGMSGSGYRQ